MTAPMPAPDPLTAFLRARLDEAPMLPETGVWHRILLEYAIPPGTDAVYGGAERETGFRLALSFALKVKAASYSAHPDYREDLIASSAPLCPGGCGCRLGTDDADRLECGCDAGCCE